MSSVARPTPSSTAIGSSGQQRRGSARQPTARSAIEPQASEPPQAFALGTDVNPVSQNRYDAYAALAQTQRDVVRTVQILQETVQDLALTVQGIRSEMPTQASIQAEIDKRLPRDTYLIAHQALENEMRQRSQDNANDIKDIQLKMSGAWMRAAPWVAIGVSLFSIFAGIVMTGVTILAAILLSGNPLP